jgi:hypothetical protein
MTAEACSRHPHDPPSRGAVESRVCQLAALHPPRRFDGDAARTKGYADLVDKEGLVPLAQYNRAQSGDRCN